MPQDERPGHKTPEPGDREPEIEDAYSLPEPAREEALIEDEAELLDASARSLVPARRDATTSGDDLDEASAAATAARSARVAQKDDTSDADSIPDEAWGTGARGDSRVSSVGDALPTGDALPEASEWERETSTHKIVVELKRIEGEIRRLLDGRDPKRKRKLGGTRRWLELWEDVLSWRYSGRIDEATLNHLEGLIVRRNHLFGRLRFLAGTRPVWNT